MKGYTDAQQKIRLFRPDMNMKRMDTSMRRMAMPALDKEGFLACIEELIRIDASWVPSDLGYSLYIRPFAIGTSVSPLSPSLSDTLDSPVSCQPYLGVHASEDVKLLCILCPVGPYYKTGSTVPVKLFADTVNVRAWPGGVGGVKVGGNYAPTISVSAAVAEKGYSQVRRPSPPPSASPHRLQVLWLFGPDHEVTEVGAMNIFFVFRKDKNPNSELELVTAPLDRGDVLPGTGLPSLSAPLVITTASPLSHIRCDQRQHPSTC
jgi:branched-chain amino acid aminotransferase